MTWRGVGGSTGRSRHVEHPLRKQFGQVCTGLGMAAVLPLPTVASAHGRWTYPGWPSARASGRCPWRLRTLRSRRVQSGARVALARFAASHHASCHHRIGSNHRKRRGCAASAGAVRVHGNGSRSVYGPLAPGRVGDQAPAGREKGVAMRGAGADSESGDSALVSLGTDAAGRPWSDDMSRPCLTVLCPPWRWVRPRRRSCRRC